MNVPKCEILTYEKSDVAVMRFHEKMEILSSAVYNGGDRMTDCVFILQVPKNFYDDNPYNLALNVCRKLDLPEDSVGFMTAAEVKYVFSYKSEEFEGVETFAAVTAGLSNQVIAGDVLENWDTRFKLSSRRSKALIAGTINIIGVSSVPLTQTGKVNILIGMTEAKTAAMASFGYEETGTTSDAIAIMSPVGEERTVYSGTGTQLGISMTRAVKHCVRDSLIKRGDHVHGNYLDVLIEAGISEEELVKSISRYSEADGNGIRVIAETVNGLSGNKDLALLVQTAVSYDAAWKKIIKENDLDAKSMLPGMLQDIASYFKTKAFESIAGQADINVYATIYIQDLPKTQAGDILKGTLEGIVTGIPVSKKLISSKERGVK